MNFMWAHAAVGGLPALFFELDGLPLLFDFDSPSYNPLLCLRSTCCHDRLYRPYWDSQDAVHGTYSCDTCNAPQSYPLDLPIEFHPDGDPDPSGVLASWLDSLDPRLESSLLASEFLEVLHSVLEAYWEGDLEEDPESEYLSPLEARLARILTDVGGTRDRPEPYCHIEEKPNFPMMVDR